MAPIHDDAYCAVCSGTQDPSIACHLHKKRAACRYYQTGSCRRGSNCPFAHVPITVKTPTIAHPAYQSEHMYTYHPPGPTPVYRPLDAQAYPVFLWQPYPLSPSFDPRYGFARQAETFADHPDDKSASSAESSSTAASMDYPLHMAYDAAWSERAESRTIQSTTRSSGNVGGNASPGCVAHGYPVFPGDKAKQGGGRGRTPSGQFQGSTVVSSPFMLPWQDDLRKKPVAYKTKPCKFYAINGNCSSGKECTFIHDPESNGYAENLALPVDAKLPPKPLNKYDEYRARDFYPITWRVIGGGVMMGGKRQICPAFAAGHCKYGDDCKLAHETEVETDPVGFIEPKSEPVPKGDRTPRQPNKSAKRHRSSSQRPKVATVPSPERQPPVAFPSTTPRPDGRTVEDAPVEKKQDSKVAVPSARDAPTPPVRRRTRSMSMVLTPPSPLDTAQSNYAAEL